MSSSSLVKCPQCGQATPSAATPGAIARCRYCAAPLYGAKPVATKPETPGGIPKMAMWLGIGGAALLLGGGCLAVVIVSVGILVFSGAATPPGTEGLATAMGAGPPNVTIDAPVPTLVLETEAKPEEPRYQLQSEVNAAAEAALYQPQPDWRVVPDPYLGEATPLTDKTIEVGKAGPLPASMDGPFAVVGLPDELAYRSDLNLDELAGREAPRLVDLRTGETVGAYDLKAPTWRNGRLAPDGQYLVGPDTTPEAKATRDEGKLFVWQPGKTEPTGTIGFSGVLIWMDFIAPRRLAVASFEETIFKTTRSDTNDPSVPAFVAESRNCRFQVFDVATGAAAVDVPLEQDDLAFRRTNMPSPGAAIGRNGARDAVDEYMLATEAVYLASRDEAPPKLIYAPIRDFGAVSPGGKYVALTGSNHVTILSAADGSVQGRLPLGRPVSRDASRGLGFSADGKKLFGRIDLGTVDSGAYFYDLRWDLTDGRRLGTDQIGRSDFSARRVSGPPRFDTASLNRKPIQPPLFNADTKRFDVFEGIRYPDPGSYGVLTQFLPPDRAVHFDGTKLSVVKLDLATLAKLRGSSPEEIAALEPRPDATPVDRSAVATVAAEKPATWNVVPPANVASLPVEADANLYDWPQAWSDDQAAYINYEEPAPYWVRGEGSENFPNATAGSSNPFIRPVWRKVDARTGKEAGPPVILWPWARPTYHTIWMEPSIAALTPTSDRLAYVDPSDASRVDVWTAAGERIAGLRPFGDDVKVEWIGWAGDKLWTLARGKLAAFTIPDCKAVCEIEGGYVAPVLIPRGGAWLAANAASHVDFVDAATGKILGRCEDPDYDEWRLTSLSLDGKSLVRLRDEALPVVGTKSVAHVWDLATGEMVATEPVGVAPAAGAVIDPARPNHRVNVGGSPEALLWLDGRRFLSVATFCHLMDFDAQGPAAIYGLPGTYSPPADEPQPDRPDTRRLSGDPFGRVWINVARQKGDPFSRLQRKWALLAVPAPDGKDDAPLVAPDREYVFKPGDAIRVDVDFVTNERSAKLAERIAGLLQNEGFVIGPNGWTMDVTVSMMEGTSAAVIEGPGSAYRIPAAERRWKLKAPDGAVVREWSDVQGWNVNRSKYLTGSDTEYNNTATVMYTDHFNFGLEDPPQAIYQEILDTMLEPTEISWEFPRSVLKQGGKYLPLPIETEFTLPASAIAPPSS